MRHFTWDTLTNLVSKLSHKYGGTVVDSEINKSWDWGQAITREMYGTDWMNDPEFKRVSQLEDSEPAPEKALKIARQWLRGDLPSWMLSPT